MTPHCSPRWPTLHFPVNEFNGLRFDLHELLHVIAGGWQCSSCACRRTTDSFGVSFLKFTQRLILRSQVLFLFLLCVLFCSPPPQDDSHSHREFFVLEKESRSLPTQWKNLGSLHLIIVTQDTGHVQLVSFEGWACMKCQKWNFDTIWKTRQL